MEAFLLVFFFITKYRKRRRNTFCHNDDVVLTLAHFSEILPVVIEAACSKFISLGENKQVRKIMYEHAVHYR